MTVHLVRYVGPEDAIITAPIRGGLLVEGVADSYMLRFVGHPRDPLNPDRDVLMIPKWALIDVRRVNDE